MQVPNPASNAPGSVGHSLSAAEFRRRFRWLIFHAWNIPPVFGLGFILLIGVLTPAQMLGILITPLEPAYILGWLAFAMWFLPRSMRPLADWLDDKPGSSPEQAVLAVRRFPLRFWTTFLVYLAIAPASVILAAKIYTGFVATPYDWFRIELVALIVSIIVGLPIFFLIFDLFGRALGGAELRRPIITVKTKVFLIGALVPLLIDTMLVQYYWTRTGYFTFETFGVWVILELLAIGGSLIFAHSFGQSLGPLQRLIGAPRPLPDEHVAMLRPRSTDELGQLTADYRLLLDELQLRREILELNNRLLRSAGSDAGTAEVFTAVVELCCQTIAADQSFLIVHDPHSGALVGVAQTGVAYRPEGYYRLSLDEQSLAVWAYSHRQTAVAEDAPHDPRVSPQLCARFGIRSAMATPLRLGDEMLGVLMVAHTANHRVYDDRDRSLIEGLAREAALALQTQRLRRAREQAEVERLEQAEQVRTLMDATEEGIYGADSNGLCTFINRAALRMLGYRQPADLLGRNLHALIHHTLPDGRPYPKEQCRVRLAMLAGDTAHADDEVHWRADGTSFPVEYWSHPIVREGRTVGSVVSFIDISARKQVENALRESEMRLQNVLAVTGEGVWDWDLTTGIVRHNKQWCQLLSLGEESLEHPLAEFAARLHEDDRAAVTARVQACLKGNGPYHSEHRLRRSDGQIIWVQDRGDVVERDAQGRALRMLGSVADISAQRQAAQVFVESEARFRSIIEASPVPLALNDDDLNITYLNPAFINTFGYTRDDIPTLTDWWPRAYPDAAYRQWVATEWAARLERARQQGSAFEPVELDIHAKDGSLHSVLVSAASLGQTFAGTHLVILYDITARKQAEQALREKEQLLSESQQIGRIGSWSWIPGTTPIYWSEETYRIYGVSPDSFVPDIQGLLGLLHPDDRPAMQAWIAACASGHAPPELEFRVILPSGEGRVLSGRGNLQRDAAGRARMVGTVQDITERRHAEQSLRTSEERLRAILETEPECVKVLAADGTLLEMNPAGLAMIEADSLAQVQGQKMADIVTGEHRAAFVDMVRCVIENGESGQLVFEIVGLKGTRRWLETNAVPLRDEASGETWLLGVTRDITDRKRAEEDIRTLNAELEQRVKDRTAELETANQELEAFSYSVSHDLRAPLRAIDGFSRILYEDYASRLNAEGQGYLDRVRNAVQRMGVLIDELLELSRVGRAALRVTTIDLSHLAAEVVVQLRHGEPARNVEVDIAPGITAQGDARLLRLVLENLLGNAWKYTAKTGAARITFTASRQDGQRVYRITDNGAGFDMQYADNLFRPFQRLHTAQEFPGSGIGLATVARIVHRHGGRVWAEAGLGKGATFFFTLRETGARD